MMIIKTLISFLILFFLVQSELLDVIRTDQPPLPIVSHPLNPLIQVSQPGPIQTNKFWMNFLLTTTNEPVHAQPYVLRYERSSPYGLAISQSFFNDDKQTATSQQRIDLESTGRVEYYFNVLNNDAGFSSTEITDTTNKSIIYHDHFGCHLQFGNDGSRVVFPIIRGMAYVTAEYENMTPVIFSSSSFVSVNNKLPGSGAITDSRFRIVTSSYQVWVLYVLDGKSITMEFTQNQLVSTATFTGTLRLSRIPKANSKPSEDIYDQYKDKYVIGGDLDIQTNIDSTNPNKAAYFFQWKTKGSGEMIHYAFPHHLDIVSPETTVTSLTIGSTTKGMMTAIVGNIWKLVEDGLTSTTFLPPNRPDTEKIPEIKSTVETEIQQFDVLTTIGGSNYVSGKLIAKLAQLCLLAKDLGASSDIQNLCLTKAKQAINPYIQNSNLNSFRYDTTWGGVIGSSGLQCDSPNIICPGMDYSTTYYNDHHYHYGYFLFAASLISHLDNTWAIQEQNKIWVENIIRDVSNPSKNDNYFPVFRSFDWFSGHSWSKGLFSTTDGNDQQSTGEEINFHYSLMLWGISTNNDRFKKLGNIMFAVAKRSIQKYFLMKSDNVVHPPAFVKNKVAGIIFENKVHYTTWSGSNTELIHGLQVVPYLPVTEEVRDYKFVKEEWDSILSTLTLDNSNTWKSNIYMSYATINKNDAYDVLKVASLDNSLSRSWALYSSSSRSTPVTTSSTYIPNHSTTPTTIPTRTSTQGSSTSTTYTQKASNSKDSTISNTVKEAKTSNQDSEIIENTYAFITDDTMDTDILISNTTNKANSLTNITQLPLLIQIVLLIAACVVFVIIVGVIILLYVKWAKKR